MWALLIGRPGVLKSPAMEEALRPLKRLSAKAEDAFKKARLAYGVAANVAKLRAQENMRKATKLLQKEPYGRHQLSSLPLTTRCRSPLCDATSLTTQTSRRSVCCSNRTRTV